MQREKRFFLCHQKNLGGQRRWIILRQSFWVSRPSQEIHKALTVQRVAFKQAPTVPSREFTTFSPAGGREIHEPLERERDPQASKEGQAQPHGGSRGPPGQPLDLPCGLIMSRFHSHHLDLQPTRGRQLNLTLLSTNSQELNIYF